MTILGKHTITETRELIGNVQYRVNDVSRTFATLTPLNCRATLLYPLISTLGWRSGKPTAIKRRIC